MGQIPRRGIAANAEPSRPSTREYIGLSKTIESSGRDNQFSMLRIITSQPAPGKVVVVLTPPRLDDFSSMLRIMSNLSSDMTRSV